MIDSTSSPGIVPICRTYYQSLPSCENINLDFNIEESLAGDSAERELFFQY